MGHSCFFAKNGITERTFCATDSRTKIFLYFFLQSVEEPALSGSTVEMVTAYQQELTKRNTGSIDLHLDEIMAEPTLRSWYLHGLQQVLAATTVYGETIDHWYLNNLPELNTTFSEPFKVSKVEAFITTLQWALNVTDVQPDEDFKWFEDPIA